MARYTDEFRAQAIVMLQAAGWPEKKGVLVQVAHRLGIQYRTLARWARRERNPAPDKLVYEKAFDLKRALQDEIQAILEEMPNARPDADFRELGTVLGIAIDKLQLLEGKATERIEMMTDDERAARISAILDAARERRANATRPILQ